GRAHVHDAARGAEARRADGDLGPAGQRARRPAHASGVPGPDAPASVALAHRALDVALLVARLHRLALVEAVLAAAERDLDLGARAVEVDAGGHEGQPALLGLGHHALDLALVGQELARAIGVVVLAAGGPVGRNVDVVQPQLAVAHLRVAVLDLRRAAAQRLDLRARGEAAHPR